MLRVGNPKRFRRPTWLKRLLLVKLHGHHRRMWLLAKVTAMVLAIVLIKLVVHGLGLERISLNPLFSALVAATVFLQGFLLNGVLSDFKESEKLPAQIATALESLALEIVAIPIYNPIFCPDRALAGVSDLATSLHLWLLNDHCTDAVYRRYHTTHPQVVNAATHLSSSTLQGRLMDQMALTLQAINRIETIRKTSFVPLVYWLASLGTTLLCGGLIFARSNAPHELMFFLAVISFNLIMLLRLIADLDNPFGYENPNSSENVSLSVLVQARQRIEALRGRAAARIPHAPAQAAGQREGAARKG